ncbi:MAG TPA: hypothetical protein VHS09_06380 [Polyangiaceae bacterium]|nr:hypothetical protein [Polyangiaceae bacterium]
MTVPRTRTLAAVALLVAAGCQVPPLPDAHPQTAQAPRPGYPPPQGYAPGVLPPYPAPPGYPTSPGYAPTPTPTPAAPGPPPAAGPPGAPGAPGPSSSRPQLGPLVGPLMWQAEVRAVVGELEASLTTEQRTLVAGIPLTFDPDPNTINAFAGCDDSGAPFVAGTEGLLETIDAIAQTRATDELFGTRTYDTYTRTVTPQLVSSQTASPALPMNVIPLQLVTDARRLSRAHEMFDEIAAFTFGHELAHHYRGHTGCAHGQPSHVPPVLSDLRRIATTAVAWLNQTNEIEADNFGCIDVLATGRARQATGLRWTEEGGLWLFDFFARLDGASGATFRPAFLSTHPAPGLRIPLVQADATVWRLQNPG